MKTDRLEIRSAIGQDAERIVDLIRSGFRPELVECFVYGCSGADNYVRSQIELGPLCESSFTIADLAAAVVGCIELRRSPTQLFLNYIAVDASARHSRVASRLLLAAIRSTREAEHRSMSLDVLEDNIVALQWYERLGFQETGTTEWRIVEWPPLDAPVGTIGELAQANLCHSTFGFSRITVNTTQAQHSIGRLGRRWFRTTAVSALQDSSLVATLRRLDPSRQLLALLPTRDSLELRQGTRLTATRRLAVDLDKLEANLQTETT